MAKGNTQTNKTKVEEVKPTPEVTKTEEVIVTGTETPQEDSKPVEPIAVESVEVKPLTPTPAVRPVKTVQGILGYAIDPTVLADHIPQEAGIDLGVEPVIMGTPIESGISVETLIQLVAQVEVTFGRQFKRDDKPRLYFS